ncbi:MAG: RNA-binding protein [Candidatus Synechococcus spongiarum 15L]|uniref:RNA-binding protein n=2 Tax=Candidatus Synechococcus spongiarum TaxID=431041 RepID=A0A1T1D6T4_9SYNE|nr:RNA-binding protein [Candidatus Synechococcus spongiarum]KKZ13609.1 MAG: RNA-binding protein [Candidatus Synechococcus spongiarum 15L]MCY4359166.1 RNA-binding protein [Cyanobacteria bacterium MAG APA_bin_95]OOV36586.1 RNA-binding protein [Candidatus Synechococcus spongiarum LMB bulk15N]
MSNRSNNNQQGIRIYVGNVPRDADLQELEGQFKAAVDQSIRFKPVTDRESGECRGFGFISVGDERLAEAVIAQFNGKEFAGQTLRVERSERKDGNRNANGRRNDQAAPSRTSKVADKLVHRELAEVDAPDPRWGQELSKLKLLLEQQKTAV